VDKRVLGLNFVFVGLFITLLFLSFAVFPIESRIPHTWLYNFGNKNWQLMQTEDHWYTDSETNASINSEEGILTISQANTTGDSWIYFPITENVTILITDWELEVSLRWNGTGNGSHVFGVLTDGKDSMFRAFLNGADRQIALTNGYLAIYVLPIVYQPTAGWHTVALRQRQADFQILFDKQLLGEATASPLSLMPVTRILVGTGYSSVSEFAYVKLTYYKSEFSQSSLVALSVFSLLMVVGAAGISIIDWRTKVYAMTVVPVFVCSLFLGIILPNLLSNAMPGFFGQNSPQIQWFISITFSLIVFFISKESADRMK
jgi:hypothetical protein